MAAYLRIWAPGLAAVLVVASGSVIAIASSVVLAALSVWSWTWRARRGALARQRGDFDRLALGSRCDPAWMTADVRERLENQLTAQLARHIGARSLDDVVQRGATNLAEALPSYGLLRLRSLRSREAAEAAGRLLANTADKLPCDGGPYRTHLVGGVPALPEAISAAAKAQTDAMRRRTHGAAGIRSHARP